ncbi:MAG: apolipoprotein N-acyltransferase, partial [Luteolibacter sp.]
FAAQFWWLGIVSPVGVVVLPLYLGLFWGLFGAYAASWGNPWRSPICADAGWGACRHSLLHAMALAAIWAGTEWLRGWLFTGFGWNPLGVAFHESRVIAQAADLFGVSGLSMLLIFFQATLLQAGRRVALGARDGTRRARHDFLIASAVVFAAMIYGLIRIASESRLESIRLRAMLVQINIPQDAARVLWEATKVHMAYEEETLAGLEKLGDADAARLQESIKKQDSGELSIRWPDWVIWPESALTGRFLRAADGSWATWLENVETISRVRKAGPFTLIQGTNELEAVQEEDDMMSVMPGGRAWNSLAVLDPQDELQTYRKRHLVIFGETIPFVDSLPWLKKLYEQQAGIEYGGSFTPGESAEPIIIETAAGEKIGAIPTICFEDTVGRLTRRSLRAGPQVIVNVTNDGWFKESPAAAQHFANARFRAIELRRPMLRSANNGVSAAVDSTGSIDHPDTGKAQMIVDSHGSHFTRGSLLTETNVPINPSFSLYGLLGDAAIQLFALLALIVPIFRSWRQRSQQDSGL